MSGIDFETLLEYARIGIRRASIFMGFGVHAAASPAIRNFDLSKETKLRVVADTNDDKLLGEYKSEFRSWVIVNGLREIHEAFTEYLEKLNQACLTIGWVAGEFTPEACDGQHKKFHRGGLPDKFEILRKRFGVITQHEDGLNSLNDARNCFTHRRGIVGPDDFNHEDQLRLRWRTLDIYFIPAGGRPVLTRDIPEGGLPMPGGFIESKYVERICSFSKGEILELSPLQLAEICYFADEAAVELANSAVEYARRKGIPINERPSGATGS